MALEDSPSDIIRFIIPIKENSIPEMRMRPTQKEDEVRNESKKELISVEHLDPALPAAHNLQHPPV